MGKFLVSLLFFLCSSSALAFNVILPPKIKTTNGQIRVMIIDTGIDLSNPIIRHFINKKQNLRSDNFKDRIGHGTNIAGIVIWGRPHRENNKILIKNLVCPQVKIYSCNFFAKTYGSLGETIDCYKQAIKDKIDIINYSAGGELFSREEERAIKTLQRNKIPLVCAAGNNGVDASLFPFYPASLSLKSKILNIYPVGSLNNRGKVSSFSNFGLPMAWEKGQGDLSALPAKEAWIANNAFYYGNNLYGYLEGTSQATALYTHRLLIKKCQEMQKINKKLAIKIK